MSAIQILTDELIKFRDDRKNLKEELADVLAFSLLPAGKHGFDVKEIVPAKIRRNGEKYPVEKVKGTARKYNDL